MGGLEALLDGRLRLRYPGVNRIARSISLAEVNAGFTLFRNTSGLSLRISNFRVVAREAAATGLTDLRIVTSEGTPVVIASFAQANLTEDTQLFPGETGVTLGAGFGVNLTAGTDIVVDKTGSNLAGSDYIDVEIDLQILNGPGMAQGEAGALVVI